MLPNSFEEEDLEPSNGMVASKRMHDEVVLFVYIAVYIIVRGCGATGVSLVEERVEVTQVVANFSEDVVAGHSPSMLVLNRYVNFYYIPFCWYSM